MRSSKVSFCSSNSNHWWCFVVRESPLCTNGWKPFWVLKKTWFRGDPVRRKSSPERRRGFRREIGQWMMVAFVAAKRDIYETKRFGNEMGKANGSRDIIVIWLISFILCYSHFTLDFYKIKWVFEWLYLNFIFFYLKGIPCFVYGYI